MQNVEAGSLWVCEDRGPRGNSLLSTPSLFFSPLNFCCKYKTSLKTYFKILKSFSEKVGLKKNNPYENQLIPMYETYLDPDEQTIGGGVGEREEKCPGILNDIKELL